MASIVRNLARHYSKRNSAISRKKTTSTYIEAMYNSWLIDPTSVHKSWDIYFRNWPIAEGEDSELSEPASLFKNKNNSLPPIAKAIDAHAEVHALIRNYQMIGHSIARLCPLETNVSHYPAKKLQMECNFLPQDWEREFRLPSTTLIGFGKERSLILKEIVKRLDTIYCDKIGVDYMFLDSVEQRDWIRQQFENSDSLQFTADERRKVLAALSRAVVFERFLNKNFLIHKNFSLTGCEMLIPAMKKLIDVSSTMGIRSFVLGLPQRGRLNILATVCKKSLKEILALFNGVDSDCDDDDLGELKYSLGAVIERLNWTTGKEIRFSIVPNPTYMQAFVPVVLGKTRSEQIACGDDGGNEVMSIIVHDDAAFHGQGIAYEAMQLSAMPNYGTHGTIHVVINSQDNLFVPNDKSTNTLNPLATQYCTNISRALNAPILHVNADDPDAVMQVCKIAAEWRNRFHKDVIIQLVGYHYLEGKCDVANICHNPTVHNMITKHRSCLESYINKLTEDCVVTADDANSNIENFEEVCQTALDLAKLMPFDGEVWQDKYTLKLASYADAATTGVRTETLTEVGNRFLLPPVNDPNFVLSKSLHRIILERKAMLDKEIADWTLAEALAFATLIKARIQVRLSIQATERDAFEKRHHIFHHQLIPGKSYIPLQNLYSKQVPYVISYTSLSESAALGFEHGYSMANPNALVLWEAQLGDFASTTQCIIDQFIATGQSKWGQQSGLVMILPHGIGSEIETQSPARLERFLQMSSDSPDVLKDASFGMQAQLEDINFIVACCTTPANYFHILRRQVSLPFRKPLVLMISNELIEHGEVKSSFQEMSEQTEFQAMIPENIPEEWSFGNYRRLIFCSGRIYYDLVKARADKNLEEEIAIARIEQLSPFPYESVREQCDFFENAQLVWVQEEHKNQGAWTYVQPRLQATSDNRDFKYIGRSYNGLTANVSKAWRKQEYDALLEEAISLPAEYDDNYW